MNYTSAYFERPTVERGWFDARVLRPDQYAALCYAMGWDRAWKGLERWPKCVLSVGCGLGLLEHELQRVLGVTGEVISTDVQDFRDPDLRAGKFIAGGLGSIRTDHKFDTVIFCESIEHIPENEFWDNWPKLVRILRASHGRLIITNWEDYHPLEPNGLDHVMLVDDYFYDRLASDAVKQIVRHGSHLVLEF